MANRILEIIKLLTAGGENLKEQRQRKEKIEDALKLIREKAKIMSPLEESQAELYKTYSDRLLGRGKGTDEGLPEMELGGLKVGGASFTKPKQLTPDQQLKQDMMRNKIVQALKDKMAVIDEERMPINYRESGERLLGRLGYAPEGFKEELGGLPTAPGNWEEAGFIDRIKAALTGGPTELEGILGPVRPGGIFKPPAKAPEFSSKVVGRFNYGEGQTEQDTALRQQAIQALEEAGAPATEENIREAIRQLKGQ